MKKMVAAMLTLMLLLGMLPAFAEEIPNYNYPEKYLWYIENSPFWWVEGTTAYDHHITMGMGGYRDGRGWNMDKYVNSVLGQSSVQLLEPFILYGRDPMGDEILAYWESWGVKKELFDADDEDRVWSLFTPLTMGTDENAEKLYPVIFNLHGSGNVIEVSETYGYAKLAGAEEFIVINPWAKNNSIIVEEVERIWAYVSEHYPVDPSRVYISGFSGGGRYTQTVAYELTSMFAAIAPSPQFFMIDATDDQWAELEEIGMPIVCVSGFYDKSFPVNEQPFIDNVIHWWTVNGVEQRALTFEDIVMRTSSEDKAMALTGLPYDQTRIERYDGSYWYIGEYLNEDDVCVIRVAMVEDMPHWPSGSWAEYNWNFLKQWSRDLDTGALIYTK